MPHATCLMVSAMTVLAAFRDTTHETPEVIKHRTKRLESQVLNAKEIRTGNAAERIPALKVRPA